MCEPHLPLSIQLLKVLVFVLHCDVVTSIIPLVCITAVRASLVKVSCLNGCGPGFNPVSDIPVTERLVLQWSPCQMPGIMRSALGLVGPV